MSNEDPLTFEVFNEIGIINQLTSTAFAGVLPKGMTIAQFSVLNHFERLGLEESSPAVLANAFQVTRPTMTSTLARMEKSGLVKIKPDPDDGRAKRVSVTPAGRKMRMRCLQLLAKPMTDAEAILPKKTLEKMLPLLREVREKLDRLRD